MKIRLLSGICYIALLVAFYCLKIFLPQPYGDFCFDGMLYVFGLIGTFEMLRAMGDRVTKKQCGIVYAFAALAIPASVLFEYWIGSGGGMLALCVCVLALSVALLSLLVVAHEETSLESLGVAFLSAVYPTLLLCVLALGNHAAPNSELASIGFDSRLFVLFVFIVSPCADSIAYVFGRFLKKYFPKKMAPKLSPNKTVIGGIGGLVGGMLGALVLFYVYNAALGDVYGVNSIDAAAVDNAQIWLPIYLIIGLLGAVATAFGDLVESCIKRKVGLKDMGNIMPGHGGVLDRLDGTMFASLITYVIFIILYAIF
ncbi:MAG: phosphatidate cytidylyltransferase [Clostridia bacterium]|nr:phosphatidate cytidylyltransferase [Clostridia bacterium]